MILITSTHDEKNPVRRKEIITCLQINLGVFDRVVVLYERSDSVLADELADVLLDNIVDLVEISARPTFGELFEYAESHFFDKICCISNSDIFFDSSVRSLSGYLEVNPDTGAVIGRAELGSYGSHSKRLIRLPNGLPNIYSADAWVFRMPMKPLRWAEAYIGELGCDSLMNTALSCAGYRLVNPCLDVKVTHLHDVRFNTSDDKLEADQAKYYRRQQEVCAALGVSQSVSGVPWCSLSSSEYELGGVVSYSPAGFLYLLTAGQFDRDRALLGKLSELQTLFEAPPIIWVLLPEDGYDPWFSALFKKTWLRDDGQLIFLPPVAVTQPLEDILEGPNASLLSSTYIEESYEAFHRSALGAFLGTPVKIKTEGGVPVQKFVDEQPKGLFVITS